MIHFFESRFLNESKLIHSGEYTDLYGYMGWVLSFLGVDVFCKHSVWISTNAFLGCTPDPRQHPCVTLVTLMTLVTLFLGYPYTISRIQRH